MTARRLSAVRVILLVLGLAIASYLTVLHSNGEAGLVCVSGGIVNCERVLTSPQAIWWNLPVALFGVIWFAIGLVLQVLRMRTRQDTASSRRLSWLRLIWLFGGTVAVLYLIYDEFLIIGRICLWCSSVHLIVFTLLVLEATSTAAD